MLQTLTIESFAIIDRLVLDFSRGMTVLSGETGAGKSIIIDALSVLCGGRGANEFIRNGSSKLVVEGLFNFDAPSRELVQTLNDLGIETKNLDQEGLIIRREINIQGKNSIRVNGVLLNVGQLKKIGIYLADIHGQHEHQALLDTTQHLALIDQLGDKHFNRLKAQYKIAFEEYEKLRLEWIKSQKNERDQIQRLNFLEFQAQEIEEANLEPQQDQALEDLSKKLQNAAKIEEGVGEVMYLLTDSNTSALSTIGQSLGHLAKLRSIGEEVGVFHDRLSSIQNDLTDLGHEIALFGQSTGAVDQSIDEIESRLDQLAQLKRKFGMELDEIITYYEDITEEIYQIKHRESYLKDLSLKLQSAYTNTVELAQALSEIRKGFGDNLVAAIEQELKDLYMPHARFKTQFNSLGEHTLNLEGLGQVEWRILDENGFETVEFYAMTNIGESFKPLVKVASGGELSRFMLALKTVFARNTPALVMVFDEIDSGVSGRVAQAIAEKMAQVAQIHQVLCITHLSQVAAIAHQQLYIQKEVTDNRTFTQAIYLDEVGRQNVLAHMLSGKEITSASQKMAENLLTEMAKFR